MIYKGKQIMLIENQEIPALTWTTTVYNARSVKTFWNKCGKLASCYLSELKTGKANIEYLDKM